MKVPRLRRLPLWVQLPLGLVLLLLLLVLALQGGLLPKLPNPFATRTEDNTGPTLLRSLQDMSRYEAASGNFQVVVDLDKDTAYLPDALRGRRTLFVGAGSVGAYVDLGKLGKEAIRVNETRTTALLELPHAALEKPSLDTDRSYVVAQERGLLDRFGDFFSSNPGSEREVRRVAARHIAKAAEDSGLRERAEENTTRMLEQMLRSLGFKRVSISYD